MSINTKSDIKAAIMKELMLSNWSEEKIRLILNREAFSLDLYHQKVIGLISNIFDISTNEIISKSRKSKTVLVRCCFVKYMTDRFGYGSSEIGRMLSKHHTTIIHLQKKMNILLETKDTIATNAWNMFMSRISEIEN